jgi:hypothetical protein
MDFLKGLGEQFTVMWKQATAPLKSKQQQTSGADEKANSPGIFAKMFAPFKEGGVIHNMAGRASKAISNTAIEQDANQFFRAKFPPTASKNTEAANQTGVASVSTKQELETKRKIVLRFI